MKYIAIATPVATLQGWWKYFSSGEANIVEALHVYAEFAKQLIIRMKCRII